MWGGENHILFSGANSSGTFNWDAGSINIAGDSVGTKWLDATSHDSIFTKSFRVKSLSSFSKTPSPFTNAPAGYYKKYGKGVWFESSNIYILHNNEPALLATNNEEYSKPSSACQSLVSGDFLYLPRKYHSLWNTVSPVDFTAFNISSLEMFPTGEWVPSLFYAQAGNLFYYNGYHYGQIMGWLETAPNDPEDYGLKTITIKFGCLLENRNELAQKKYGYSEIVTEMNGFPVFILSIFLSRIKSHPNTTDVYLSITGTKHGGTAMSGFHRDIAINLIDFFGRALVEDISTNMWTFNPDQTNASEYRDGIGIIVSVGKKAKLYRWAGYLKEVYSSEEYHSNSISHDGEVVAIFEGNDIIEKVSVFNIFSHETIVVSNSVDIESYLFSVGEIIPVRLDNNKPKLLPYEIDSISSRSFNENNNSLWYPPYANISLPDKGNGVILLDKLHIEDGVATIGHYSSPCMDWEVLFVIAKSPDSTININVSGVHYSGPFKYAAKNLPKVLFSSTGEKIKNEICFADFGNDPNAIKILMPDVSVDGARAVVRTLDKNIRIGRDLLGDVVIGGTVLGELECSDSFEDKKDENGNVIGCVGGEPVYDCGCETYYSAVYGTVEFDGTIGCQQWSASSSCGEFGTYKEELKPIEIHGDSQLAVGKTISVTGGVGPFSWSGFGCASYIVDESTRNVTFTSFTGCCGSTTIRATDSCGFNDGRDFRYPSGQWVLIEDNYNPPGYTKLTQEVIIGKHKYFRWYGQTGGHAAMQRYLTYQRVCLDHGRVDYGTGDIVATNMEICGEPHRLTYYARLPGSWHSYLDYGASSLWERTTHAGVEYYGWIRYSLKEGEKVWEWQCL
jgi:hypothetical protein